MINCLQQSLCKNPTLLASSSSFFPRAPSPNHFGIRTNYNVKLSFNTSRTRNDGRRRRVTVGGLLFPVDPWAPTIDSQSIASQLFAFSLFPYIGFLYFITKSKSAPKLTLFGFYFLLAFVGATIPAGIYAKVHYGTSLSNVDWLHGGAESLLTLTNLFIVIGLRQALRKADKEEKTKPNVVAEIKDQKTPFP